MVHCGVEGRGIIGAIALSDSLRCVRCRNDFRIRLHCFA